MSGSFYLWKSFSFGLQNYTKNDGKGESER